MDKFSFQNPAGGGDLAQNCRGSEVVRWLIEDESDQSLKPAQQSTKSSGTAAALSPSNFLFDDCEDAVTASPLLGTLNRRPALARSLSKRPVNASMSLLRALEEGSCRPARHAESAKSTRPATAPSVHQYDHEFEENSRREASEPDLAIFGVAPASATTRASSCPRWRQAEEHVQELPVALMSAEVLHAEALAQLKPLNCGQDHDRSLRAQALRAVKSFSKLPEMSDAPDLHLHVKSDGDSLRAARDEALAARMRLEALVNVAAKTGCSQELGPKFEICTMKQSAALQAAAAASSGRQGEHWYSWMGTDLAVNRRGGHVVQLYTPRRALAERRRLQKKGSVLSKTCDDVMGCRGQDVPSRNQELSRADSELALGRQHVRPSTAPAARFTHPSVLAALSDHPTKQRGSSGEQAIAICTEAQPELQQYANPVAPRKVMFNTNVDIKAHPAKAPKPRCFDPGVDLRFVQCTTAPRRSLVRPRSAAGNLAVLCGRR